MTEMKYPNFARLKELSPIFAIMVRDKEARQASEQSYREKYAGARQISERNGSPDPKIDY